MPVRADILKALEDFIANEGGMKFQHLAVALGRNALPEERSAVRAIPGKAPRPFLASTAIMALEALDRN